MLRYGVLGVVCPLTSCIVAVTIRCLQRQLQALQAGIWTAICDACQSNSVDSYFLKKENQGLENQDPGFR